MRRHVRADLRQLSSRCFVLMAVVAQSSLGKHDWELLMTKSLVDSSIPSKQTNMCQGV